MDGRAHGIPPWTSTSEGAATVITGMVNPTIADYTGFYLSQGVIADQELHTHINDKDNWTQPWNFES
ncbi:hypothetical protein N7457_000658 [Penicillium paradoxum]|uniref:uncharacterized protein n=1 Tax=Penicillium paradoxum TaxID=176176 RepID=UPI002546600A|nr:uncharacterized protein N7457_000658 [Penicillium paradoxum]KAJ5794059.1 hypothetical protein N7457_000658 [Penicillium paradoxum]